MADLINRFEVRGREAEEEKYEPPPNDPAHST